MWKLDKPSDDATKIFKECVSNKKESTIRTNLLAHTSSIKISTDEFESKFLKNEIHKMNPMHNVYDTIPKKEWEKIYTDKFVKKGSPGRIYYDKLLSLPKYETCPLCAQRTVSTLDHYLPKTVFPTLVVSPLNLVACCFDCNKIKNDNTISSMEDATIHPYFDDIDNDIWLVANIIEGDLLSFKFFVIKPISWDTLLYLRVKKHFEVYELNKLYTSHASREMVSIQHILIKLYKSAGIESVKSHIKTSIESCTCLSLNSWRVAMYRALYNNEWFYNVWLKEHSSSPLAV